MELMILLGIGLAVCHWAHQIGKSEGSRKGYGIGRWRSRRHR